MLEILKPSTCMTVAREGRDFGGEQSREGAQQFKLLAEEGSGPVETEKCMPNTYVYSAPGWAGAPAGLGLLLFRWT